jgi:predicted enzyme related to lactoylglutathione lyase
MNATLSTPASPSMLRPSIAAVMVHVANVEEAFAWYGRVFEGAVRHHLDTPDFDYLQLGDARIEFVPADAKVPSGPGGTVVYWQVPQFEHALARFQAAGATLYRGPMAIEDGHCMCQMQDPWSNCIGLRGPSPRPGSTSPSAGRYE